MLSVMYVIFKYTFLKLRITYSSVLLHVQVKLLFFFLSVYVLRFRDAR